MTRFGTLYLRTIVRSFSCEKCKNATLWNAISECDAAEGLNLPNKCAIKQKHLFSCSSSVRSVSGVFYQSIDCDTVCLGSAIQNQELLALQKLPPIMLSFRTPKLPANFPMDLQHRFKINVP